MITIYRIRLGNSAQNAEPTKRSKSAKVDVPSQKYVLISTLVKEKPEVLGKLLFTPLVRNVSSLKLRQTKLVRHVNLSWDLEIIGVPIQVLRRAII